MMRPPRPDLNSLHPAVRLYIEALEAELIRLGDGANLPRVKSPSGAARSTTSTKPARSKMQAPAPEDEAPLPEIDRPAEPPTTVQVITASATGLAKRTARHHYLSQRRGGMGIFDLETPKDDPPAVLALADLHERLLLLTRMGRVFHLHTAEIVETPVRGRGASITARLNLDPGDGPAALIPEQAQGYLALAGESGMVRLLRHHVFGNHMKPGTPLYDFRVFGPLAAACWTPGSGDLFVATRRGRAIRFAERTLPPAGALAIRLAGDDAVIGVAPVADESGVFLLSADGKGAVRSMAGFSANKSPGAGGKAAVHSENVICALSTDDHSEALVISRLGKIIRFPLEDVLVKDAPVQGVNCMSLRADEPVAAVLI